MDRSAINRAKTLGRRVVPLFPSLMGLAATVFLAMKVVTNVRLHLRRSQVAARPQNLTSFGGYGPDLTDRRSLAGQAYTLMILPDQLGDSDTAIEAIRQWARTTRHQPVVVCPNENCNALFRLHRINGLVVLSYLEPKVLYELTSLRASGPAVWEIDQTLRITESQPYPAGIARP